MKTANILVPYSNPTGKMHKRSPWKIFTEEKIQGRKEKKKKRKMKKRKNGKGPREGTESQISKAVLQFISPFR